MSFRKKNEYSENRRFEKNTKKSSDPVFWRISTIVYENVSIVTNISVSIILIFVLILKVNIDISEKVISNLIQIATSFGALSLAIPLFLKDFKVQKTLWLSFLSLAILFVFSTILGIVLTVFLPMDVYNIQFTLVFVSVLIFSFNIRTTTAVLRLRNKRKNQENLSVRLRPSEVYDFIGILILIIVSISFGKGIASSFFILFFYSILVLVTIIISSVITSLTTKKKENVTSELKQSIQKALESKPETAFTEQQIIDDLRTIFFKGRSEQISRTSVLEAISEMDSEVNEKLPKATIYSYNLIIPRWNDNYRQIILSVLPDIIFFKSKHTYKYDFLNKELFENEEERILSYLSKNSQLSIELLRDGNALGLLIDHLNIFRKKKFKDSSYNNDYILAFSSDFVKKELGFINISSSSDLFQFYNLVENKAYISKDFYDSNKYEIIKDFIEIEIPHKFSFKQFFQVEQEAVLKLISDAETKINEREIENTFYKQLFINISWDSIFYRESKKITEESISSILENLIEQDLIEKIVEGESYFKEVFYKMK